MDEISLLMGRGQRLRKVVFQGHLMGERCSTEDNLLQQLYVVPGGRLIVYEEYQYDGDNVYNLVEVTPEDLEPFGAYEWLGKECGFGRTITLDEALKR